MAFSAKDKKEIEAAKTVAYWSDMGGIEVKFIEYGIDDYLVCVANAWNGHKTYHKLRIHTTHAKDSRTYVVLAGHKLYLDECVRTHA